MISTLLIISFGCLYNADLVRPESDIIGKPHGCFTNLDCNTGEKCSLPQVTNLLPGLGGPRQGTCEEVPEVPYPTRKLRMCLLPGKIDPMARLNRPFLQVDIVLCEAYEICMPDSPDDTSNLGGFGLGMCQSRTALQPPPPPESTTTTTTVGPTKTTEVRSGMNLCDPLMKKNGYEINMVICEANEICQPLAGTGDLAKIGTCHPTNKPELGKTKACMVDINYFKKTERSSMLFEFDIYKCSLDTYCKPFGDTGISAMLGQCKGLTPIPTRSPTLGPVTDPDTTTDYYVYSKETSSEETEVAPHPPTPNKIFTYQMCLVTQDMARNSKNREVLLNIQIVRCKPEEICHPEPSSQYYGYGLGKCKLGDVVTVARASGKFSTLLKIIIELNLVESLQSAKAQTIFAPSDEAFAKLDSGILENLTIEQKLAIILRHVLGGVTLGQYDITDGPVKTLGGESIELFGPREETPNVQISYEGNTINVVTPDVMASNGCIMVIDEVIMPEPAGNVVDVAEGAGNFKTLLKILSELEVPSLRSMTLVDILKMQREVTVFAPTDEAFAKLPEGTLESLTKEQKLKLVSRHFVPGVIILAADVSIGSSVETFGGESMKLSNIKGVIGVSYKGNYISAVSQGVKASNGVIHAINEVILPGNVVDVAKAAGNFKTILKILSELEVPSVKSMTLVDILKMQREVTIFAPTDKAFAKLPEGTLESLTKEQKLAIVSRHFVTGVIILEADVTDGPVKTFGGESIQVFQDDAINPETGRGELTVSYGGRLINVVTADVMASNGVIHVIDDVILPGDVVDVAIAAGNFKTLVQIIADLGLVDKFKGQKAQTIFAPSDEAFAKLPEGTLASLTNEQKMKIVARHVVYSTTLLKADIEIGPLKTLGGEVVDIIIEDSTGTDVIQISYKGSLSSVVTADVMASNGVIHVIDNVILPAAPPLGNVVDVALAAGNFRTLVGLLLELNLVDILKIQKAQTIFAPSDEAFAKLPRGTLGNLTERQKMEIVERHIVPGLTVLAADIEIGPVKTLGDEYIEISIQDESGQDVIQIQYEGNFINVVTPDVMASNGVIHVVDKVILPITTTTVAPPPTPILPGLNLCIPALFDHNAREDVPYAQINIVKCGANEVCQKIGEGSFGKFGTCKPTGNPLHKATICLTGNGNRKSLPNLQLVIVECGADEFCKPFVSSGDDNPFGKCTGLLPPIIEN